MTTDTGAIVPENQIQTPENTTPPPLPQTAHQEVFIASPNARTPVTRGPNGKFQSLDPNKPKKPRPPRRKKPVEDAVEPILPHPVTSSADQLLKNLVTKMVAMENDLQYKIVWVTFFRFGGVYNGPRYYEELEAAVKYLKGKGM